MPLNTANAVAAALLGALTGGAAAGNGGVANSPAASFGRAINGVPPATMNGTIAAQQQQQLQQQQQVIGGKTVESNAFLKVLKVFCAHARLLVSDENQPICSPARSTIILELLGVSSDGNHKLISC